MRHFQDKIPENGRKNIFRDRKTTNNVPLMFLDVKVLTERKQWGFWTSSRRKQGTVYVFTVYKSQNKPEKSSSMVRKLKGKHESYF